MSEEEKPAAEYVFDWPKDRVAFHSRVERAAFDSLRNAVAYLRSLGFPATLELEASRAFEERVKALQDLFRGGAPFPQHKDPLKPGRSAGLARYAPDDPRAKKATDDTSEPGVDGGE